MRGVVPLHPFVGRILREIAVQSTVAVVWL
jgi:hypothetical protein